MRNQTKFTRKLLAFVRFLSLINIFPYLFTGIYPSYNQIITQPMDLGTIKTRIDDGHYTAKDDLIADIQLVWNNAKKFNPIGHFVHDAALFLEQFAHGRIGNIFMETRAFIQKFYIPACISDKIKKDGPHSISRPIAPLPPPRETSKRDARKKSLDLPGETQLPQHLEQNRNATGSMRACETLLRNLMTQKIHRVSRLVNLLSRFFCKNFVKAKH